jgi:hypothetical protein
MDELRDLGASKKRVVIENDEIPERLVSRIAVRSDREVMLRFEPACIHAADFVE